LHSCVRLHGKSISSKKEQVWELHEQFLTAALGI
jgi:hypothetical protein